MEHVHSVKCSWINSKIWFFTLYLILSRLSAPQSRDPQEERGDGDADLQDWQNYQHSIDASYEHLVGHKKNRPYFTVL